TRAAAPSAPARTGRSLAKTVAGSGCNRPYGLSEGRCGTQYCQHGRSNVAFHDSFREERDQENAYGKENARRGEEHFGGRTGQHATKIAGPGNRSHAVDVQSDCQPAKDAVDQAPGPEDDEVDGVSPG